MQSTQFWDKPRLLTVYRVYPGWDKTRELYISCPGWDEP